MFMRYKKGEGEGAVVAAMLETATLVVLLLAMHCLYHVYRPS